MFSYIGSLAIRLRFAVLAAALAVVALGLAYGTGVTGDLVSGGFDVPGSDSVEVQHRLVEDLGLGEADVIALFGDETTSVDDPTFAAAAQSTLDEVAEQDGVVSVTSAYNGGGDTLVSFDGSQTFAVISLEGSDDEKVHALPDVVSVLRASTVPVQIGGTTFTFKTVSDQVEDDLRRAELLSFGIVAVLLIIVFGSLVASLLPLIITGLSLFTTFLVLRLVAQVTDLSIFALNAVVLVGLGLSIDYSLLVVNRYREELGSGLESTAAVVRTVSTAGKTVAFSGAAVAVSMLGLLAFPQTVLRSMGLGGALVAFIAVVWSLTVRPALLAFLGPRVNALSIRRAWIEGDGSAFWSRLAHWVMRRPIVVGVAVAAVLIAVGLPFLRVEITRPDPRVLGTGAEARQVFELLRDGERFPPNEATPVQLLVEAPGDALAPENVGALFDYVTAVEDVRGVQRVDSIVSFDPSLGRQEYQKLYSQPLGRLDPSLASFVDRFTEGNVTLVSVVLSSHAMSHEALDATGAIRAIRPPGDLAVLAGGQSAGFLDVKEAVFSRLPFALAFIAFVTFVALFLAFGSIVVPVKAIIMNVLSLGAAYGALVLIFQDGNLEGLLGFESVGAIHLESPVLMFAIVFGLSMDYEVFLLSRIKEEYDATGDNQASVARGLERTGRIITSAALLLVVVTGAFATSEIIFIKEVGVGTALAVALDATLIRALLVPATMRLMGSLNWWAPGPLQRIWLRLGMGNLEGGSPGGSHPQEQ
ncbi:MAG TPA: MMPL family transporter [Dehalococcoidia bacterium]|nr:MMPL family transporter [Dehalococcoidia bacterium]